MPLAPLLLGCLLSVLPRIANAADAVKLVVLGDSIAEGYGIPKDDAFPAVMEKLLHEDGHPEVTVINAGIAGSTSASGLSRLKWQLKDKPRILIVELGANDALRGLKPEETGKNLTEIVELAKQSGIQVVLAGMQAPPNYGSEYSRQFRALFPAISKREKIELIPFVLQDVAGIPSLNQEDGIHPNEKGARIVARNVLKYVKPLL